MKIRYFTDTDTLYIEFKDRPVAETRDLDENTVLDVDSAGNICAITVEHASTRAGIPEFSRYVADYCRATGRAGIPDLEVYMAYNFFRLAAIFQGILGRVRDGTAASGEASRMALQVEPLAETAWSFARRAGA